MTADPAPAAPAPAVTIRVAEPREYDAVRALLLRAYESRFWITSSYRESLLDIEGHVADHGPGGPRGEDLIIAADGGGDAGDDRILGAVFVPRGTQTGPAGSEPAPDPLAPERLVEQTPDGAFRRRTNHFRTLFGDDEGQAPVEPGRYRLYVSAGCGWSRRQTIVLRLTGLDEHVSIGWVGSRTHEGRTFDNQPGGVDPVTGARLLDDLYRGTDPGYQGRATVPTVYDLSERRVVSNDYHLLSYEWETAWRPLHAPGAPDLYPADLRDDIDALNQQLFDDVNNGPYKVLFAGSLEAARVAKGVWEARLAELDFRLATRRYLFGERLTDSDVRLFVTLLSFDQGYRPSFPPEIGTAARVTDFPSLWAYARDLFATPGFVVEPELRSTGVLSYADGTWRSSFGGPRADEPVDGNPLARWTEPADREGLGGSPLFSGPGGAGSWEQLRGWTEARRAGRLTGI